MTTTRRGMATNKRLHKLALQAQTGDKKALEELLVDHEVRDMIYKLANTRVGSANADDVYQEVRLQISQKIATWQETIKFSSWIGRITKNACVDFFRKTKPNWIIVTDTFSEPQTEATQLQEILEQEMEEIAGTALQKLKEECQRLIGLVREEANKKKVMEIVNLPRTTFYRRLNACFHRWRQAIQKIMQLKWNK
jgi:RNA polymerase sigma-70 factor (ECF subfamily)